MLKVKQLKELDFNMLNVADMSNHKDLTWKTKLLSPEELVITFLKLHCFWGSHIQVCWVLTGIGLRREKLPIANKTFVGQELLMWKVIRVYAAK